MVCSMGIQWNKFWSSCVLRLQLYLNHIFIALHYKSQSIGLKVISPLPLLKERLSWRGKAKAGTYHYYHQNCPPQCSMLFVSNSGSKRGDCWITVKRMSWHQTCSSCCWCWLQSTQTSPVPCFGGGVFQFCCWLIYQTHVWATSCKQQVFVVVVQIQTNIKKSCVSFFCGKLWCILIHCSTIPIHYMCNVHPNHIPSSHKWPTQNEAPTPSE